MNAKVMLLSKKDGDIEKFLNKFLNKKIELEKSNIWQKDFSNPIEISEIVAAFIDNIHSFNLIMWPLIRIFLSKFHQQIQMIS